MKRIIHLLVMSTLSAMPALSIRAQDMVYSPSIGCPQLFMQGDQMAYPIIRLNSSDQMELQFDDLDGDVKNYYYTFQLCNEDWTPADVSEFDYLKGFSQMKIDNYQNSSIAVTQYTHYHAVLPDPNCIPAHSGNYVLKVFLDGDTSKLAFTRRFLVTNPKVSIQSQLLQPMDYSLAQTDQHITLKLNTMGINPTDALDQIKVDVLQNYRWDNVVRNLQPNFDVNNSLEYNNDGDINFEGGWEWRFLDLRSFHFQSDRIASVNYGKTETDVFLKPDGDRSALAYSFYADYNGAFALASTDQIQNVNTQGDYAHVLFSFVPKDKTPFPDKDVYVLGRFTGEGENDSTRMVFNPDKGRYERHFLMKMGVYNYSYVTLDKTDPNARPSFAYTEGNHVETENDYIILVYYRAPGARADELVGIAKFNSRTGK